MDDDGDDDARGHDAHDLVQRAAPRRRVRAADLIFGQPSRAQVIGCAGLRWVHLSSAGYTTYDDDEVRAALVARVDHFVANLRRFAAGQPLLDRVA